jgi:Uma2 family endonuclease
MADAARSGNTPPAEALLCFQAFRLASRPMNALAKTHPSFTSAEFYKMASKGAFAGFRVELRRGMIVKMSPKWFAHGAVQADLMFGLKAAVDAVGLDWLVVSETTVNYGGGFEPMPDLIVLDPALLPQENGPIPPAAVKLIVEVGDTTIEDDLGDKREDYARAGVAEYWVADVNARELVRHADPGGETFGTEARTPFSEPLAMLTAPAVTVRLK